VTHFRLNLLLTGLGGLLANGLLAAISVWLISSGILRPPLTHPAVTLISVLIFGGFSLAEIPMMVFAMRRLILESHIREGVVLLAERKGHKAL